MGLLFGYNAGRKWMQAMARAAEAFPWKAIVNFLARIGTERDFPSLIGRVLLELPRIVPYDFSYACFNDGVPPKDGGPFSLYSIGLPDKARADYLNYYYRMDPVMLSLNSDTETYDVDWRDRVFRRNEFVNDYIVLLPATVDAGVSSAAIEPGKSVPKGFSIGFMRSGQGGITTRERKILAALQPHIVNFFSFMSRRETLSPDHYFAAELARDCRILSRREAEVAVLLCKRLRAREIATVLLISPRTVERHIEHIYEKLDVSDRRGLLVKLLGRPIATAGD